MKKARPLKQAHTMNAKYGMGDYYGTGVKNPMGRIIDSMGTNPVSKKKMGNPPKSLA